VALSSAAFKSLQAMLTVQSTLGFSSRSSNLTPSHHVMPAAGSASPFSCAMEGFSQSISQRSEEQQGHCIAGAESRDGASCSFSYNDLNQGMAVLGHGFSDLGQYISKSITFLTFALIVRAVVDLGFVYILGMVWMVTVAGLFAWNLHLQACLAKQRWNKSQLQKGVQKTTEASDCADRLEAELGDARRAMLSMELANTSLQAELEQGQNRQKNTECELQEARVLLLKMSNELTHVRGAFETTESQVRINRSEALADDRAKRRRSV